MSSFELSQRDVLVNLWVSIGAAGVSLALCGAVLGLAYYVWSQPHTRPMIDRISFRLLLLSVAFEMLYDIMYILTSMDSLYGISAGLCSSSLYFMIASMTIVNYLCTCIAVNLMLTITFGVNPVKLRLERLYIGGSILIGILVPLVPAAMGHFRNDPTYGTCWISGGDLQELMTRLVLDLYLWQILACAIATFSVIVTLYTLYRQGRELSAALFAGNHLNRSIFSDATPDLESGSSQEKAIKKSKWRNMLKKGWKRAAADSPLRSQLEDRFLIIAFQISLYPISLIIVNGIISTGELVVTQTGVETRAIYALYCIYYFLYGGRGIAFAALAFFIDPCFRRALGEAWRTRHINHTPTSQLPLESNSPEVKQSFAEMLGSQTAALPYHPDSSQQLTFQTGTKYLSSAGSSPDMSAAQHDLKVIVHDGHRSGSAVSYDMPSALSTLAKNSTPDLVLLPPGVPQTRSFPGVFEGYLPKEITDEIDTDIVSHPPSPTLASGPLPGVPRMTGLGVTFPGSLPLPVLSKEDEARLAAEEEKAIQERKEKLAKEEMEALLNEFLATKAML